MKFVEKLDALPYYEQDSGENITYQFVVKPGAMGLMSAGRVRLKGPTQKALDTHAEWDQLYIVLSGSGTAVTGRQRRPVAAGCIVRIPSGTAHAVVLAQGEALDYIYVNAFSSREAVDALAATVVCQRGGSAKKYAPKCNKKTPKKRLTTRGRAGKLL